MNFILFLILIGNVWSLPSLSSPSGEQACYNFVTNISAKQKSDFIKNLKIAGLKFGVCINLLPVPEKRGELLFENGSVVGFYGKVKNFKQEADKKFYRVSNPIISYEGVYVAQMGHPVDPNSIVSKGLTVGKMDHWIWSDEYLKESNITNVSGFASIGQMVKSFLKGRIQGALMPMEMVKSFGLESYPRKRVKNVELFLWLRNLSKAEYEVFEKVIAEVAELNKSL